MFLDESTAPSECTDYGEDYIWVESLPPGERFIWDPTFGEAPTGGADWMSWIGVDLCGDVTDDDPTDNVVSYQVDFVDPAAP